MNRKTRKGLGAILASVGVTTLLGVMSGTGVVRADVDEQDPPAGAAADATATVEMKQRCQWYVSGVPSSITLVKTGDETSEVYDGTQFDLEADIGTISAFTDGNLVEPEDLDADSHTFCTLFGEQTGIVVTGSWDSGEFIATAADSACAEEARPCVDTNMDFTAGFESNPDLVLSIDEVEDECRTPANDGLGSSDWTVNTAIDQDELPLTNVMSLPATNATPVPKDEDRMNDACDADLSVTASIPTGKTPLYAGKSYSFSGPTFTTEIEITTDR